MRLKRIRFRHYRLCHRLGHLLTAAHAGIWNWTFLLPYSAEEGRALARPAPGWCKRSMWKPQSNALCSKSSFLDTKRFNNSSRSIPQTTPVPLRDRCRCASVVAVRRIPSRSQEGSQQNVQFADSHVHGMAVVCSSSESINSLRAAKVGLQYWCQYCYCQYWYLTRSRGLF
jgi:hypothetical protein